MLSPKRPPFDIWRCPGGIPAQSRVPRLPRALHPTAGPGELIAAWGVRERSVSMVGSEMLKFARPSDPEPLAVPDEVSTGTGVAGNTGAAVGAATGGGTAVAAAPHAIPARINIAKGIKSRVLRLGNES